MPAKDPGPYWSIEAGALAARLQSGPGGLSAAQASAALAEHGPNSVGEAQDGGALRLLLRQFESPLVLILIFAALISLSLREWVDAAIILTIVLGSSLLSFTQEYRASTAVEGLRRRLALTCRVLRDGAEIALPVVQVVPGDVILLQAGNLIPADGVVTEAQDFLVAQAAMTGEAFPVEKRPGVVEAASGLSARTNAVYLGASVQSGTARVLVTRTGRATEFGSIAARLRARPPETEFARGVREFGGLLMRVMLVIVVFVLMVNLGLGRPVTDSLLFAVALAVGISPELLPAIISVTLSAGARKMSQRGVIVRRLDAIENLGSMDILCTDKTGTLTTGVMTLQEALDCGGRASAPLRHLGFLNASFQTGISNPLDESLVAMGTAEALTTRGYTKIDEIPYDFNRRRLTVVLAPEATPGRHLILSKGAFANILEVCTAYDDAGTTRPLDTAARAGLQALFQAKGDLGLRVLALATAEVPAKPVYHHADEAALTFRGFLLFADPAKPDAKRILADMARLGIAVKIISGDNRHVTAHVAAAVGLNAEAILTGEALNTLSDEALWHLAPKTDLFAEIDPQQKERVVRSFATH